MNTGPSTLPRMCTRTMVKAFAPEARAASTKSRLRTWVVTLSATRVIGGMNTMVSETMLLKMPAPSAPEMAIASSTDGKAKNTSMVRMMAVFTWPPAKPAVRPSTVPMMKALTTGMMPMNKDRRPP